VRALLFWLALGGAAAAQDLPFDPAPLELCVAEAETGLDAQACIGLSAQACMETPGGETTVGMGMCYAQELDYWDGRLNAAYKALMEQHEAEDATLAAQGFSGPGLAVSLRDMQRAWIAWRDAACAYEFALWTGGTGGGPAATACRMQITAEQALELEARLGGEEAQ